ncbi:SPX domain-containing protein [Mycena venus]|uniref:SPX domain-containing protein n=1 Tax=Mycena venus TaxID=2733690 RepID=A0A8H6Y944_9AGAR|nr:SPX domain-containing protein [Mycena venus]
MDPTEDPLGAHTYLPNGLLSVNPRASHPIPELIARAEAAWAAKLSGASTTLRQAAAEYTRRYNRLPPRGFDKWWAYAAAHDVALPDELQHARYEHHCCSVCLRETTDEYDQIDHDLAPFYGVDPVWLQGMQREWEAHADSSTIGKDAEGDALAMLNFTLHTDEGVRLELASGGFQIIELLREVEADLPPFRAVFSPHDNPNLVVDWELRQQALDAAKAGTYIDPTNPPPGQARLALWCPPLSPAWLDVDELLPPFDDKHPNGGWQSVPGDGDEGPKTFIHDHLSAMDPCLHPAHLRAHGAYLAHGAGPALHRFLVPQFSYSVTPLHADLRVVLPVNWVSDDLPHEDRPPPLGFSWDERVDARLQWRGSNTGIWHAADGRWREAHRVRLAALGAGVGGANVSLLDPGMPSDDIAGAFGGRLGFRAQSGEGVDVLEFDEDDDVGGRSYGEQIGGPPEKMLVGPSISASRARLIPALLDVAFAGRPLNCEAAQCAVLQEIFEWRKAHDLKKAGRYKYVIDATTYPEWYVYPSSSLTITPRVVHTRQLLDSFLPLPAFHPPFADAPTLKRRFTDCLVPWVHYVPIQNSYADLLDALVFFRAHEKAGTRIAGAGWEWSRWYWRQEDLVAYMYR